MKKDKVTIGYNSSVSVGGNVWMSQSEIARLFEVYIPKINSNIRSILKSNIVMADFKHGAIQSGNTLLPDYYNLKMITALAFRIDSPKASIFRNWIIEKAQQKDYSEKPPIIIQCGDSMFLS